MKRQVLQQTPETAAGGRSQAIVVKRIRFVTHAPAGAKVLRRLKQPWPCVAVEEAAEVADLAVVQTTPQLLVAFVPKGDKLGPGLRKSPDDSEDCLAVEVEWNGQTIHWCPGMAVVEGRTDRIGEVLAALADFAFYEGELRTLEQTVEAHEGDAQADVLRAHRIRYRDRKHWDRFGEMIEQLARVRLTYARLEPRLAKGSRSLPIEARRLMSRLLVRADVEARLEALNDRLEACEDLYEGANDRVSDYRGYFRGHMLEVAIIVFLLLEVLLMAGELYLRYLEYVAE
jgi:hypothetical protein